RRLEPGRDRLVVAHGRLVYRWPDAHAHSHSPHAHAYSRAYADAWAHADTESWLRLQRDSSVDRSRDLHGRPARESERLHLRSQVVDSKPESGDQFRRRWAMAAYRPLPYDAHANSLGADADADGNTDTSAGRDV